MSRLVSSILASHVASYFARVAIAWTSWDLLSSCSAPVLFTYPSIELVQSQCMGTSIVQHLSIVGAAFKLPLSLRHGWHSIFIHRHGTVY